MPKLKFEGVQVDTQEVVKRLENLGILQVSEYQVTTLIILLLMNRARVCARRADRHLLRNVIKGAGYGAAGNRMAAEKGFIIPGADGVLTISEAGKQRLEELFPDLDRVGAEMFAAVQSLFGVGGLAGPGPVVLPGSAPGGVAGSGAG